MGLFDSGTPSLTGASLDSGWLDPSTAATLSGASLTPSQGGSTGNFDLTGSAAQDQLLFGSVGSSTLGGTDTPGSVSAIGGPPAVAGSSSLNSVLSQGLSLFNSAANIGLGIYKGVANTQNQQTGQPERLPDGRIVSNIAGQPQVYTPQTSNSNTSMLLLVVAAVVGAVVLLKKG